MFTVVTHTQGNRPESLARCVESVQMCLIPGIKHIIIQTKDILKARWDACELDEYIAFVDDDDIVVNNSLMHAYEAIQHHKPGLVFTDQARVNIHGKIFSASSPRNVRYSHIATHPGVAHHLAVINTAKLSTAHDLHVKYGGDENYGALEWLMKGEAAMKGDAVHIPLIGYHWTTHTTNHSNSISWQNSFARSMAFIGDALIGMRRIDAEVITWTPVITNILS